MQLAEFIEYHRPALEMSEVKYGLILGVLGQPSAKEFRRWTLDAPGACAIQSPLFPIILGALAKAQCQRLAEETRALGFPGVVGCDDTARWFVERAVELGLEFREPIPQRIHALYRSPIYPGAPGRARQVCFEDTALFEDWTLAFLDEAVPHDRRPARQQLEKIAGEGRYLFWVVDDQPVSMAGIVRRTRNAAAIGGVYTPPSLRARGYAGSVTAAVVERIFAEAKTAACLYTDLRNPFSNRCYARIGFEPVCDSLHFVRDLDQPN
ncbi:MAG: GNAT family N-acetyltransferase [Beijerinckiaceae bacterium]